MQNALQRIEFLGCPIDSTTMQRTVDACLSWCQRDGSAARRSRLLVTVNAAMLVMMQKDERLRQACHAGELIVPDGVPVVWASRLLGRPLQSRVAGCDLMGELLRAGAQHGLRVFFLGAREDVVSRLAREAPQKYPGLRVVGYRNGYFGAAQYDEVVRQVRDSGADILLAGMPTPFKEVWCHEYRDALGVPVIFGVGGSFDVHTGLVKRAPRWMQNMGMEWFWRLLMEPRRMWKRYLVTNTLFVGMLLRALMQARLSVRSMRAVRTARRTHSAQNTRSA